MSRVYDNWERLVRATLLREELKLIAQMSPSDISSSFSSCSSPSSPRVSPLTFFGLNARRGSEGIKIIETHLPNGDMYIGTLSRNVPHGSGKYLWTEGRMYEGEWKRGKASGKGKFSWPCGATFEGEFKSGRMEEMGTFIGADGDIYKGSWSVDSNPEPVKKVELRRSASESRVSRDLFQSRFIDNNNFQLKQPTQSHSSVAQNATGNNARPVDHLDFYSSSISSNNAKTGQVKALNRGMVVSSPWKAPPRRKSFFDIADVFPEPKQATVEDSIYGFIEKRLKMRGIDEPSNDREILKQILGALQLKGLLHSNRHSEQRNFVSDRSLPSDESPIVVMRGIDEPSKDMNIINFCCFS